MPVALVAGCGGAASRHTPRRTAPRAARHAPAPAPRPSAPRPAKRHIARPPFHVTTRTVTFVDPSRRIRLPSGVTAPRRLVTVILYPARAAGPEPLVIFGHGFRETPQTYGALLEAWARAGYVVAAPTFPLENADAPGGPNESDLVNQPRDMSFVISELLARSGPGFLHGRIDAHRIGVTGQSDGGETALAVAYDAHFLDRRVRATVILSGAQIPGAGHFAFPHPSPPLLATQGTADAINPPSLTAAFFDVAPRPKYLLELLGASHLPPYTFQQPWLRIVERVSTAFLDRYLKDERGALARLRSAGDVHGVADLRQ